MEIVASMRLDRSRQVLSFLQQPIHLVGSVLDASVIADVAIALSVFTGHEDSATVCAIVTTTFAELDGSTAVTLEAFSSRSSNDGRPSIQS